MIVCDSDDQQEISTAGPALNDLNDECLLKVFRMLSLNDVTSIYDTCSRFRTLAMNAFTSDYSQNTLDLNKWYIDEQSKFNMVQISSLLTKFGSLIAGVKCNPYIFRYQPHQILNLILDNCCGALKSLTLSEFHIDGDIIDKLTPICDNLETLRLDRCELGNANGQLLPQWNKMVNLDISFANLESNLFDTFHPQLQSLSLGGAIRNILKAEGFLRSQNHLRELSLSFPDQMDKHISKGILNTIVDFCSNFLTSLKLIGSEIDNTLAPKVRELFSRLESLELFGVDLSTTDELFRNCKKLRTLKIQFVMRNFYPATANADISELQNFDATIMTQADVERACDFLLKCPKLRKLVINIYGDFDTSRLYKVIEDHLNELKTIRVVQFSYIYLQANMYIPSARLPHIKKLSICNYTPELFVRDSSIFLKSMVSIESVKCLHLTNLTVDDRLIEVIAGFRNLQQLELIFKNFDPDRSRDEIDSIARFANLPQHKKLLNKKNFVQLQGAHELVCDRPLRLEPLGNLAHLSVLKIMGEWKITNTDLIDVVNKLDNLKSLTLIKKDFVVGCEVYQKLIDVADKKEQRLAISTDGDEETFFNPYIHIERDIPN